MEDDVLELVLEMPGERLDRALVQSVDDLSRTQIQRFIKEGRVLVNGRSEKANLRLEGGEQVQISLPPVQETELIPEDIPLDIRYEDTDLLLINKPAGMVVHPAVGHPSGTLVNAVLGYCQDLAGVGGEKRPGIVHRLDMDTSGLILVAKNDRSLQHLQDQFKSRTIHKEYLALVEGQVQPPSALIDAPIGRDLRQRKKMAVIRNRSSKSRPAQTEYETHTTFDDFTLLSCILHTGRTHQIRVHLAYLGHPIVADTVYGRRKPTLPLKRQFLHAYRLIFKRPSDDKPIQFEAELPTELQAIVDKLSSE
ncbi:MAG: RluA family pseudouridine synthase [Chloroflexota bacterium]